MQTLPACLPRCAREAEGRRAARPLTRRACFQTALHSSGRAPLGWLKPGILVHRFTDLPLWRARTLERALLLPCATQCLRAAHTAAFSTWMPGHYCCTCAVAARRLRRNIAMQSWGRWCTAWLARPRPRPLCCSTACQRLCFAGSLLGC